MPTKILMVCLGNICRSPLAEGILQSKVDPNRVFIDSAGTGGYHIGNHPNSRSIDVAMNHGIDISHQRCRQFTLHDFIKFDLIFVMDKSNFSKIKALARTETEMSKVRLLLNEVELETEEVPDPYYGGENGFEYVFHLIDIACEAIAQKIEKKQLF